jgi:nucleoside-diphosphate-sugar epimerase
MKYRTVLTTGGAGFLGIHLVDELQTHRLVD